MLTATVSGGGILFHGETGETHLLDELPLFLLSQISTSAKSFSELEQACSEGGADAPNLPDVIASALAALEGVELATRHTLEAAKR
jgi:hypothetical protein